MHVAQKKENMDMFKKCKRLGKEQAHENHVVAKKKGGYVQEMQEIGHMRLWGQFELGLGREGDLATA
jgi:hypothetical protein